jgi:tRNA pseudouridine32 synthase/23S rRNA pseudouridine746 synthase
MSQPSDIQILFCDDALLVVNKPAGLSTLPDGYNPTLPHIKSMLERQIGPLWIVHRLDKETSGVMILARSAQAHRSLNTQFEKRLVSKVYHALVFGNPGWQENTVSLPLRPNGDRQHRTVIDPQAGKPAVTHLKVLERFGHYCLVQAIPETGRTHQIRAHLYALGLSILGDKLYAKRNILHDEEKKHLSLPDNDPWIGLAESMELHAVSLEVNHPLTGERMKFTAPYPSGMMAAVEQLRSQASGG